MDKLIPTPSYELDELIAALKPYQAKAISELLKKHSEEDVARLWLSSNGPSDTQQFGGEPNARNSKAFWDKFSEELHLFICGDKKYEKERDKFLSEAKPTSFALISGISGLIGSTLGFAPSLLAPAVAVMLYVIGKIGINAWCKCN